jgi:hypothetical protein
MHRRSPLSTTATLLRQALAKAFCCRWILLFTLLVLLLSPEGVPAAGVQALFDLETPTGGPFPSDLFTVADPSHNTGMRINLPLPDCVARPSDCDDLHVINTLDGFNQQPRLSIPFSGPIEVATATSASVFLINLGSTLPTGNAGSQVVGINQIVWDPETNTLHVEADEFLAQHTRYVLVVTNGLRDLGGGAIEASEAFAQFRHDLNFGQTKDPALKAYGKALQEGLAAAATIGVSLADIVVASVFTTQSATAVLEKIRDQLKAAVPAPADFLLGPGGTEFNENMPLRNQDPVINTVPGAIAIQQFLEHWEWVSGSANAVAYAVHLQKQPLVGMPAKPVILQFAKGDKTHPNPTTTAMLRAGDLGQQATYYRNDLAFTMEPVVVPKDPHLFLQFNNSSSSLLVGIALDAQEQMAEFLASDGTLVIDPDGSMPLFEVPIVPPLPEELNFIP